MNEYDRQLRDPRFQDAMLAARIRAFRNKQQSQAKEKKNMNPTAEQIEQCAQVCWAAQRALRRTQSAETVPVSWEGTTYEQRQTAREQVCLFWHQAEQQEIPMRQLEIILVAGIVNAFKRTAWIEEAYALLCQGHDTPITPEESQQLREMAATYAFSECNYFEEGLTPREALAEEQSRGA